MLHAASPPRLRPRATVAALGGALLLATCASETGRGLVFVVPAGDGWREVPAGLGHDRPSFVDFGRIPNGTTVTHTFYLRNTDPVPVVVDRLSASCTCTVPVVRYRTPEGQVVDGLQEPGQPVLTLPPDAVAEVTIRIDSTRIRTKNVDKYNFVRIATDSVNTAYVQLEAHLIAEQPFRATPAQLDFGLVAESGTAVAKTEIVHEGESLVRVVGLLDVPPSVVATLESAQRAGIQVWALRAELLAPGDRGAWRGTVTVELETLEGGPYPPLEIPLRAQVVPDIEIRPGRLHLGRLDPATGGEGTVELVARLAGLRFDVLDVAVEGDRAEALEVDWTPASRDAQGRSDRWEVRLSLPVEVGEGVVSGTLRVAIDDEERSPIEVPYVGLAGGEEAAPDQ